MSRSRKQTTSRRMLRDAQQLEMRFSRRLKISHTTTKQLYEIAVISYCYENTKDEEADSELRLRTDD